jgi:hypothetical protein
VQGCFASLKLLDAFSEHRACLAFTTATAVSATCALLQLSERMHAIGRFATNIVIGDGIAEADIHAFM